MCGRADDDRGRAGGIKGTFAALGEHRGDALSANSMPAAACAARFRELAGGALGGEAEDRRHAERRNLHVANRVSRPRCMSSAAEPTAAMSLRRRSQPAVTRAHLAPARADCGPAHRDSLESKPRRARHRSSAIFETPARRQKMRGWSARRARPRTASTAIAAIELKTATPIFYSLHAPRFTADVRRRSAAALARDLVGIILSCQRPRPARRRRTRTHQSRRPSAARAIGRASRFRGIKLEVESRAAPAQQRAPHRSTAERVAALQTLESKITSPVLSIAEGPPLLYRPRKPARYDVRARSRACGCCELGFFFFGPNAAARPPTRHQREHLVGDASRGRHCRGRLAASWT